MLVIVVFTLGNRQGARGVIRCFHRPIRAYRYHKKPAQSLLPLCPMKSIDSFQREYPGWKEPVDEEISVWSELPLSVVEPGVAHHRWTVESLHTPASPLVSVLASGFSQSKRPRESPPK